MQFIQEYLKNIYMFMYLRSLKMNQETSLEKMVLHKYISESERLDQVLEEYIQNDKIKAIFVMNSIQLFFYPKIKVSTNQKTNQILYAGIY